jgi:polygalacturonase
MVGVRQSPAMPRTALQLETPGAVRPGVFDVLELGVIPGTSTASTAGLQRVIDACAAAGGGTVLIPSGIYLTGTLWMRSNITLQLEAGAKLVGVPDAAAFPIVVSKWEGSAKPSHAALIAADGVENIAIIGRGEIDGGGEFWWDLERRHQCKHYRPGLIRLIDCRNVLIDGISLVNSGFWTLSPVGCDNVTINGVRIKNPPDSPNTDGINPDSCSNVRISNCHIDVGDDCVAIKSGTEDDGRGVARPCENITITNCTMLRGHGGVVMGSETHGSIRNVVISNCVFYETDRGIRFKSRRGRGGVVEDVRVTNIVMDGVLCPLVINLFYECGAEGASRVTDQSIFPLNEGTPRFRRLRFSNITARRAKYAAAYVLGLPEMFVEDVCFDDISLYLDPTNTQGGPPAMAPNVPDLCRAGVVIRNARNIKLRRIDVMDQVGPAVSLTNAEDVVVQNLSAQSDGDRPIVALENVTGIRTDSAPAATANGNGRVHGHRNGKARGRNGSRVK